ncbi:MAG: hypothetical protein JNM66_31925 [Bryobacterales bacterium]|nr:hypothetical protein [Bryobacterales bacterium]
MIRSLLFLSVALSAQTPQQIVQKTPGFAALWDFVKRTPDGRFASHSKSDLALDPVNYVRDYWNEGRPATAADFPVINEGPFGQAVVFKNEPDSTFRPTLLVPRARLHNTAIDAKGPGRSASMVVWLKRESGNHAIAGIWHEGTDMGGVARVEAGRRQYALFAGLAANNGASAAHVSENGARSFGDKYARNLSVTPEIIPLLQWSVVAFVFDNKRNTVTSYLNGRATDYWIDNPERHPFFQWPAKAWGKSYNPPESKPRKKQVVESTPERVVELLTYEFTKVRITREKGAVTKQLVALRVNPYWFPHDLYNPLESKDGGPFTIGRVIHTSRSVGFTGAIGGVAVFDRALNPKQMRRLAAIGAKPK